jgi:hypothetical protein
MRPPREGRPFPCSVDRENAEKGREPEPAAEWRYSDPWGNLGSSQDRDADLSTRPPRQHLVIIGGVLPYSASADRLPPSGSAVHQLGVPLLPGI